MHFVDISGIEGAPRTKIFCRHCEGQMPAFTGRQLVGLKGRNMGGNPACAKCGFYYVRKWMSPEKKAGIFTLDSSQCVYCGVGKDEVDLEIDHLVPVIQNGSNDVENLVLACHRCNMKKQIKPIEPAFGRFRN